jgi:zinc protease
LADAQLEALDQAIDDSIAAFLTSVPDQKDFARAKNRLIAEVVYAQDSQVALARWYGSALATGETIEEVAGWADRVEAVTVEQALAVARKWLDKRRAVTGYLMSEAAA